MEYWMFVLISILVSVALSFIDGFFGMFDAESGVGLLSGLYSLAVLIPSIAVGIRRLHDRDMKGWWLLLVLIPLIGPIILIVLLALPGTAGSNQYGPDPLAGEAAAAA